MQQPIECMFDSEKFSTVKPRMPVRPGDGLTALFLEAGLQLDQKTHAVRRHEDPFDEGGAHPEV